jgi:hypothetical protein
VYKPVDGLDPDDGDQTAIRIFFVTAFLFFLIITFIT